jgi:hypothetical protein
MTAIDADVSAAIQAEGREAYRRFGEAGEAACKYKVCDGRRTAWYTGYLNERTRARLARSGIET